MPGESSHEFGRAFVNNICLFFEGKHGFTVRENCYEGQGAASLNTNDGVIYYDILMHQTRQRLMAGNPNYYRTSFFCECKWRRRSRGLLGDFKEFIVDKALESVSYVNQRYNGNFHFLFITNQYFKIKLYEVGNINYINTILLGEVDQTKLQLLMGKMSVLVLPDWLLSLCLEGV